MTKKCQTMPVDRFLSLYCIIFTCPYTSKITDENVIEGSFIETVGNDSFQRDNFQKNS